MTIEKVNIHDVLVLVVSFVQENRAPVRARYLAHHGAADGLEQDEGQLAALTFLSCAISATARRHWAGLPAKSGDVLQPVGKRRGKMNVLRAPQRCRESSKLRGKFRGEHHAYRDASPWNRRSKTGRRFQRMAKCVAEIEQRALAGLALVARDDRSLGGRRWRWHARRGAAEKMSAWLPRPAEEGFVAEHAVFATSHSRRETGAATAYRARRVGDYQNRLVKGAEQFYPAAN